MAVLTIDPGAKTGGALLSPQWLEAGPLIFTISKPTGFEIYRAIRWAKGEAAKLGEQLELLTEGQFLGRGDKANPASTLDVARAAERWLVLAELQGVARLQVQPSEWQGPSFASVEPCKPSGAKRTSKEKSMIVAERCWPALRLCRGEPSVGEWSLVEVGLLPSDPIDAAVMARWRLGRGQARPRAPRKPKPAKRSRKS